MTCSTPVVYSDYFLQGLIDVNNANFWEGMILIVDSNCDHVYIDPQTLFESYLPATFLSLSDTPSTYTGSATYLVRVNTAATGLEFIDPLTQWRLADELVASQAGQPAGYLEDILIGTTGQIVVSTVWPNVVLSIDPAFITWATEFIGLTDCPNSYWGMAGMYPRVNQSETGLEFSSAPGAGYRAKMWMSSDQAKTQAINVWVIPSSVFIIDTDESDYSPGSASMISSTGWHAAIKILESGYYRITLRGNMKFTRWVLAGRVFVYTTGPTAEYAINDCKFGSVDNGSWHWAFPYEDMVVNYAGESVVYLLANTYVLTAGVISTDVWAIGWGITDGTLTILSTNVIWGWADFRGHTLEVSRFSY